MKTIAFASTILLAVCAGASADIIGDDTFTWSQGDRAAKLELSVTSPNTLVATLTNTSTADVRNPSGILTAVFFDTSPTLTLTKVSAVLATGSAVGFGGTDAGGVVGGEWAYANNLSGAPGSAALGISSAGFGLFGPGDLFPGSNLQGPESPDGLQYGLTSVGDNLATGNKPVTGTNALIQSSVVFTFTFDPAVDFSVSNVKFQYGTSLEQIPAPGAALLALVGLGIVRCVKRRLA
jgi:hypothetical protein